MLRGSRMHLTEAGESYFEHMRFATLVGTLAVGAGLVCILHAAIPGICQRTCSRAIGSLQRLFADRSLVGIVMAENSALIIFVQLSLLSCVTAIALTISIGGTALAVLVLPQAFVLPLIFLTQNPQLEMVEI